MSNSTKPYCVVGAGELSAHVWKNGDCRNGWRYNYNLFRLQLDNGHVSQAFTPNELVDLVKLCHVLATVLLDDGCLEQDVYERLDFLVEALERFDSAHCGRGDDDA